jgi:hypothetical protein
MQLGLANIRAIRKKVFDIYPSQIEASEETDRIVNNLKNLDVANRSHWRIAVPPPLHAREFSVLDTPEVITLLEIEFIKQKAYDSIRNDYFTYWKVV